MQSCSLSENDQELLVDGHIECEPTADSWRLRLRPLRRLCAIGFENMIKKLSRKRQLNPGLWSPNVIRDSQSLYQLIHKLERQESCSRAIYPTLNTTPASHVYHTTLYGPPYTQRQKYCIPNSA